MIDDKTFSENPKIEMLAKKLVSRKEESHNYKIATAAQILMTLTEGNHITEYEASQVFTIIEPIFEAYDILSNQ